MVITRFDSFIFVFIPCIFLQHWDKNRKEKSRKCMVFYKKVHKNIFDFKVWWVFWKRSLSLGSYAVDILHRCYIVKSASFKNLSHSKWKEKIPGVTLKARSWPLQTNMPEMDESLSSPNTQTEANACFLIFSIRWNIPVKKCLFLKDTIK